ncbi:hypothetical protein NHP200010_14890 [Helicobacter bizzozeronii]|uniref:hypothetical protein n=1 Tax=Helicobacter bizzozeronii TaxID=56877 RepID=UPI0018F7E945|nr:hypothetical protein [Helicobacter bizzozeronii]GMB93760.1 hypothetical protein NHP200010_14890 [Helicobacter bizzozeronii]
MATLDFEKLAQQGIKPQEVLDFIKGTQNNFNLDALERYYKDNGLDSEQITRALYRDLSHMSGFNFVSPLEATKEQATPLFTGHLGQLDAQDSDETDVPFALATPLKGPKSP